LSDGDEPHAMGIVRLQLVQAVSKGSPKALPWHHP